MAKKMSKETARESWLALEEQEAENTADSSLLRHNQLIGQKLQTAVG